MPRARPWTTDVHHRPISFAIRTYTGPKMNMYIALLLLLVSVGLFGFAAYRNLRQRHWSIRVRTTVLQPNHQHG